MKIKYVKIIESSKLTQRFNYLQDFIDEKK